MEKIELEQLRIEIIKMTPRTKIYKVLKEELNKQGRWKDKPRGNRYILKKYKITKANRQVLKQYEESQPYLTE